MSGFNRRVRGELALRLGRGKRVGEIFPGAIFSRINSSVRNAAWPSFMWNVDGSTPSARIKRVPPMPSKISCMMRVVLSPP